MIMATVTHGIKVAAAPLNVVYKDPANFTRQETKHKANIEAAVKLANVQIQNMRKGFEMVKAGDEGATKLYHAAFGKNANMKIVDENIKALEDSTVQVQIKLGPYEDEPVACIDWFASDTHGVVPSPVYLGKQFHGW
ncbi:hypothetical protein H0H93_003215 [Arthromyces matolae]|nr:hypothetical protein H0H93_003215 [Arthromyces matolae]